MHILPMLTKNFALSYLDDTDLGNVQNTSSTTIVKLSRESIPGTQVVISGGRFDRDDNAEMITVYHEDIKGGNHERVTQIPKRFGGDILEENAMGMLSSEINVFQYIITSDEWVKLLVGKTIGRKSMRLKGCSIDDKFLFCGGELKEKVELVSFLFTKANAIESCISSNENESHKQRPFINHLHGIFTRIHKDWPYC